MRIPTQAEIEDKLRGEDLNTWLDLWRVEQGPAKPAALKLITAAIPFPIDRSLRVLDLGCGPGDAGRAIHSRFPHAQVDFADRNEFFIALCSVVTVAGVAVRKRAFVIRVASIDRSRNAAASCWLSVGSRPTTTSL